MTQQYLRNLSLIVANPNGDGVDLGTLRVVFDVRRGDLETPNSCDVKVYNLSDTTANQLAATQGNAPEFTQLVLKASYGDAPLAQVFWGSITQVRKGREDQRNSYVAISAADGDEAYNFSPSALSLAAGATPDQALQYMLGAMAKYNFSNPTRLAANGQPVTQGYIPPSISSDPTRSLRGRVYYGDVKHKLRQFCQNQDAKYSCQDGQVQIVPNTGYVPEPAVLITPSTGLIGVPEQTQNGLRLRVLLNPSIKIGRTIKLDSTDINQVQLPQGISSVGGNLKARLGALKLNADGLYYVMRADHTGDSRGTPWYTDLTCLAVDATQVPNSIISSTTISGAVFRY